MPVSNGFEQMQHWRQFLAGPRAGVSLRAAAQMIEEQSRKVKHMLGEAEGAQRVLE